MSNIFNVLNLNKLKLKFAIVYDYVFTKSIYLTTLFALRNNHYKHQGIYEEFLLLLLL